MERLPLIGGSYAARSIIANCQRCINLYPEANRKDAPVPITHYQRPGLRPLCKAPTPGPVRGIYQSSVGNVPIVVVGQEVYYIPNPNGPSGTGPFGQWKMVHIGSLNSVRTNPVSMVDNRSAAMIVDGSQFGYTVNLLPGPLQYGVNTIADPTGTFQGATKVDYLDTFILYNFPGTNAFGCTISSNTNPNPPAFNPLYVAEKVGYPDVLQTLFVNKHQLILFGLQKSEIWYDAGNPLFPFAELPGAYIEHGCLAIYSVAYTDVSVFWLALDLQGQAMVLRQRGYSTSRISNHALEFALRQAFRAGSSLQDAIGFTYQIDGHPFYMLTFPSADMTWVYDDSIEDPMLAWHQEGWSDSNGVLHRHRANAFGFIWQTSVVGDWENGTLYELDPTTYTDTVDDVTYPISFVRTFPHLMSGISPQTGQIMFADGRLVKHEEFQADIEVGTTVADADGVEPQVTLRYSDDRGATWSESLLQSNGKLGEYVTRPNWTGLGQAMDRVYEISHSIPGPAAINGAWVRATVLSR